jgi:hypothetical protein
MNRTCLRTGNWPEFGSCRFLVKPLTMQMDVENLPDKTNKKQHAVLTALSVSRQAVQLPVGNGNSFLNDSFTAWC